MTGKTEIQWTDSSWNPTSGCDRISPGCDHCYAMTLAKRLKAMGSPRYQQDGDPKTSGPGFGVAVHPDALDWPLRKTKPLKIFVNSMSDLFHKDVPDAFIAEVFAVMSLAHWHTFQLLTKRHARMKSLLTSPAFRELYGYAYGQRGTDLGSGNRRWRDWFDTHCQEPWPLPNVWLGVSAEDQHWANLRIPALLHTPAAVRFVSAEPLLGPIDLHASDDGLHHWLPDYGPVYDDPDEPICQAHGISDCERRQPHAGCSFLDWVIIGGESGPGARPMELDWARSMVEQCESSGVAPFVKQLGAIRGRELGSDSHGGNWDDWPADLRIRKFPDAAGAAVS
jgi:protein gp37